jgi:hypothetical protein
MVERVNGGRAGEWWKTGRRRDQQCSEVDAEGLDGPEGVASHVRSAWPTVRWRWCGDVVHGDGGGGQLSSCAGRVRSLIEDR